MHGGNQHKHCRANLPHLLDGAVHESWRLPNHDVVLHAPSEWYGESQRRCEAACEPSGEAGSAAVKEGRPTTAGAPGADADAPVRPGGCGGPPTVSKATLSSCPAMAWPCSALLALTASPMVLYSTSAEPVRSLKLRLWMAP